MKSNWGMFIKVITLYIGTVIGAGFASGQEILQFFISYGYQGIWGVVVATILFAYLGMVIMYLATKLKSENYQEVLPFIMGPASRIIDIISLMMLVGGLGIMFTGSGVVLEQHLGLPAYVGVGMALIITIAVICGGVERVLSANLILVPVKLFVVWMIAILAITNDQQATAIPAELTIEPTVSAYWLWASILYVSYNLVVPLAALSSVGKMVTMKTGVLAGLVGGIILGGSVGLITLAGLNFYPEIFNYSVPMLYMASDITPVFKGFFALLIWCAILTTAIANAHGVASRMAPQGGKKYKLLGGGICLAVLPMTQLNFVELVQTLYPLFGYAGLILMLALLIVPVIRRKS